MQGIISTDKGRRRLRKALLKYYPEFALHIHRFRLNQTRFPALTAIAALPALSLAARTGLEPVHRP